MAEGSFGNFRFRAPGKEKKDKASSLHHELQIDIMRSECRLFDQFLLAFSVISLAVSVLSLVFDGFPAWEAGICIVIALLVDSLGIFSSTKNLLAFKEMNNMKIRKTLIYLFAYVVSQIFHVILFFALNAAKISDDYYTVYGLGYTYIVSGMVLAVILVAGFGLYFLHQIKILADTIAAINGLSKNKEATYRSRVGVLDN